MLRTPDIIFLIATLSISVVLIVWLGRPIWQAQGWQSFLFSGDSTVSHLGCDLLVDVETASATMWVQVLLPFLRP